MKKYLGISLALGVTFIAGRGSLEICQLLDVHALEEKCATTNGDVNADGLKDVTDAVTLLSSLFLGDPAELVRLCDPPELAAATARIEELEGQLATLEGELAACQSDMVDCSTALETATASQSSLTAHNQELQTALEECLDGNCPPSGLPATGQAVCHNETFQEIPCEDDDCPGQDGFYSAGCPNEGRFTDNGDGTVTDNCTGLMWQRVMAFDRVLWCQALLYCEDLTLAGYDDWRLPNVREVESLLDYGRTNPAIDPIFQLGASLSCWSSTTAANIAVGGVPLAFYGTFGAARIGDARKENGLRGVLAVRNP